MTGGAWQVGDIVSGLYRITEVHTHGGMGLVYRLRHLAWNIDLAMKSPRPGLFVHPEDRDRFVGEAQTWISLGLHPHVCSCFYVRMIDGVPRIFAEYAEGGSVRDLINGGRLGDGVPDVLAKRLDLAIQMAWGLDHAHRRGVVHQDVKPANVLLDGDGTAKVTDFGLSRARAVPGFAGTGDVSIAVTAGGFTPAYASPEQVAGERLGRRTDVWSFAATVLETFTGGRTWPAGPLADAALARSRDAMPARLADLLARCLRPEPAQRPGSMAEIGDELRDIHEREIGPYSRTVPVEAAMRADELNNRALSLLDLGDVAAADDAFAEALRIDPNHLAATFNSGLARWRRAEITDGEVVAAAARAGATDRAEGAYLLAQVHLERGDLDAALPLLREAADAAPADAETAETLRRAEAGELALRFEEKPVPPGEGRMRTACVSADGRLAMTSWGNQDLTPYTMRKYLFGAAPNPHQQHQRLVRISEVGTGREHVLRGSEAMVCALDLSADGRLAASGTLDGTARVWDVASGKCLHVLTGHEDMVRAVRFSPDGRSLATTASDKVRLWNVATGRCRVVLAGHTAYVSSVDFSADGSLLASVSGDRTLRLWTVHAGLPLRVLTDPETLTAVALSADGRVAVTGSYGATRVWDLAAGDARLELAGPVEDVSLREGLALTGDRDGEIRLWDLADGRCLRTFEGHRDQAAQLMSRGGALSMQVRFSVDGRRAISISSRSVTRSWGIPTGYSAALRLCRPRPHARVQEVAAGVRGLLEHSEAALADGRVDVALTLLSEARTMPGYERDTSVVAAWQRLSLVTERVGLRAVWLARVIDMPTNRFWYPRVRVSADGRRALSSSPEHALVLWDLDTGRELRTYTQPVHPRRVADLDMTADAAYAIVGDEHRYVQLWDLAAGTCVRHLGEQHSSDLRVAIDRTGRRGLSTHGDGILRLWDLATGRQLRTFAAPREIRYYTEGGPRWEHRQVNDISLSRDGRVAMAALQDGRVLYWRADRRRPRSVLDGHGRRVDTVAAGATGRFAVTGGWDGTVRQWDLGTGTCVQVLEGHTHPVHSVDMTTDGRYAMSAGMDDTVRVWDIAAGRCVQILEGNAGVMSVSISEDGTRAASIGRDGALRVWELDWELTTRAESRT